MRMCQPHWDKLKKAINDRGLDALVAKDGEAVAERLVAGKFEPLMGAHNAIFANALDTVGLALMTPNEDGSERCPICFLTANCACPANPCDHFEKWIDRAADDARVEAVELGLLVAS